MSGAIGEDRQEIGFALAIRAAPKTDRSDLGYRVQSESFGFPEEMIFTILKSWIKVAERRYDARFMKQHATRMISLIR